MKTTSEKTTTAVVETTTTTTARPPDVPVSSNELPIRPAPANYALKDTLLGDDLEPTHPFQRITGGASFKVTRDLRRSDVPPACIMDLRAVEGHVEIDGTPIVRLTWTWPGAHMTHGVAAAVEIRGGNNRGNIETDFDSSEVMSNVMKGNLCPLPAGFTHDVTIALPLNWQTKAHGDKDFVLKAYLAARVINAHGLKSEPSRKVIVEVELWNFTEVSSENDEPSVTTVEEDRRKKNKPSMTTDEDDGSEYYEPSVIVCMKCCNTS
ncbi:uncharacterized protein LOC142592757 isoform X3 [Dermacentor variabilis]|uniref:uncharacterized protein LOC142592757 isoform X3 n=1 Tax=Dermacentor variabilis TaxID=34621 RepID=UPI003F5C3C89